jgi:hypothetical protein
VVRWLQEPTEPNRRLAETAAEQAGTTSPAGTLAQAAFWSGGSMSRADLPPVEPPPDTANRTVAAALLAAATADPAQAIEAYTLFLSLAREVSTGKSRWVKKETKA